jgi:hypothetical protein
MLVQPVESTLGKGQCDQHGLRRDTPVVAESLRRDYENRQLEPNDPVFRSNLPVLIGKSSILVTIRKI